jgi:hypothetical protein
MVTRRQLVLVLAGVFASFGASYRTTNFFVEAPTAPIAEQVGKWAEYYRKEKALQWTGREMPAWPEPCRLRVTVTANGAGGATTFNFSGGQVWQEMHIEGPLDRLIASVLPHEVTHTVFAHYFRRPVPRWADEGGAVLSEDDIERSRHDLLVRQILNTGHAIPLSRLFALHQYPPDVGSLYAEGYSVANFLVASSNRKTFLEFVAYGMQYGWDSAAQSFYRYQNVKQLEAAWIDSLRNARRQPSNNNAVLAARSANPGTAEPVGRVIVRLTAPPVDPLQEMRLPVVRAQAPDLEQGGGWSDRPQRTQAPGQPKYLPEPERLTQATPSTPDPWRPPSVRLGMPQFDPQPARQVPSTGSPVGYPRQ